VLFVDARASLNYQSKALYMNILMCYCIYLHPHLLSLTILHVRLKQSRNRQEAVKEQETFFFRRVGKTVILERTCSPTFQLARCNENMDFNDLIAL